MFEFDNIELLYESTCIPMKPQASLDQLSSDFQTGAIQESQFSADIINDDFKDLDHYDNIKPPANCFLLYRSHVLKEITARYPGHSSRSITSIIADNWKNEPLPVKDHFKEIAAKEKAQFKKKFPEYRRVVKSKPRKRSESFRKSMLSNGVLTGEDLTSPLISDHNFSSISRRKRSYSMPELPDSIVNNMRQRRYSFTPQLDTLSRLGPLLPLPNLNSYKKTYLSQALGKPN